jgi:hypothetical protein
LLDQLSDLFKVLATKSIGFRQYDLGHPELGIIPSVFNVNVDWFLRFTTEKEESVSLASKNLWHTPTLSRCGYEVSEYFSAKGPGGDASSSAPDSLLRPC